MAVDGTKTTMAALRKGLLVDTGIEHTFVVDIVLLHIEWPKDIVDRLPGDFVLTLTVPGEPKQKRPKSAGVPVEGDMVRFAFEWDDKSKSVKLEASGNGQTIALWTDHVAGDLSVDVGWDEHLDPMLAPHKEVEVEGEDTGAGETPNDLGEERLHA